jgi:hypothetical protein
VVIDHLRVMGVSIPPTEANAPLVVDPDTPLAGTIAAQLLQAVARRGLEIRKSGVGIPVAEAGNHGYDSNALRY